MPRPPSARDLNGIDLLNAMDDVVANFDEHDSANRDRFDLVHYSVDELNEGLPGYEVVRPIGRGGMGAQVFLARQLPFGRDVAIKVLPDELAVDPRTRSRFEREARAQSELSHPHIVSIHQSGATPEGHLFIAMEYVDGPTLEHHLADHGRLGLEECLELLLPVCEAVAHAHQRGISHRDLKPSNILLGAESSPKVADFGLAKFLEAQERQSLYTLTQAGAMVGTMGYMAPEQLDPDAPVDHRADVYSMGVVLYRSLTGVLPTGRFPRPSAISGCEPWVDGIVLKALESSADDRYQSMEELREALVRKAPPPKVRNWWQMGIYAALGTVVLMSSLYVLSNTRSPQNQVSPTVQPVGSPFKLVLPAWSNVEGGERDLLESQIATGMAATEAVVGRLRKRIELSPRLENFVYSVVAKYATHDIPGVMLVNKGQVAALADIFQSGSSLADHVEEAFPRSTGTSDFWISFAPVLAEDLLEELKETISVEDVALEIAARVGLEADVLYEFLEQWARSVPELPDSTIHDWALAKLVVENYSKEAVEVYRAIERLPRQDSNDWRHLFAVLKEGANEQQSLGRIREGLVYWKLALELATRGRGDSEWVEAKAESANLLGRLDEKEESLVAARAAMEGMQKIAAPSFRVWAICHRTLGDALNRNSKLLEAEALIRPAMRMPEFKKGKNKGVLMKFLATLAENCSLRGELNEAESLYRSAIETAIGKKNGGVARTSALAHCKARLGGVLVNLGKRKEGAGQLVEALEMHRSVGGELRIEYAACLTSLGEIEFGTKRAIGRLSKAIEIWQLVLGKEDARTANARALKAVAEYRMEPDVRADAAIDALLKEIDIVRGRHGESHSDVVGLLTYLNQMLARVGRHEEACTVAEEIVRILSDKGALADHRLPVRLAYLATTTEEPGKLKQLVDQLEKAIENQPEWQFGQTGHAIALNALGTSLGKLGEHRIAKPHLEHAVAIARQQHTATNPNLPFFLRDLGHVRFALQDWQAASDCMVEAVPMFVSTNYPIEGVRALSMAANSQHKLDDVETFVDYFKQAADLAEVELKVPRSAHLDLRMKFAGYLFQLERANMAREQLQKVFESSPRGSSHQIRAADELARHYLAVKDYRAAIPFYEVALPATRKTQGFTEKFLRGTSNLATCLRHIGESEQAAKIYRRLIAIEGLEESDPLLLASAYRGLSIALRDSDTGLAIEHSTTSLKLAFAYQMKYGRPLASHEAIEATFKENIAARGDDLQSIEAAIESLRTK